ncbi:MAG TPA: hypothetical protein VKU83_08140 [Puia sp.]|nr:hypothetical protein [Puia sp.]
MKRNQLIAISALSVVLAATTVYLIRKSRQNQRKRVVANAGYEMAYDIHYPMKYSTRRRPAAG